MQQQVEIRKETREMVMQQFCADFYLSRNFTFSPDRMELSNSASINVRDIVTSVAETAYDRHLCWKFACHWGESVFDDRNVIDNFLATCNFHYMMESIDWLTSNIEHLNSADDYVTVLRDNPSWYMTRWTDEIIKHLSTGGMRLRAKNIAHVLLVQLNQLALAAQAEV